MSCKAFALWNESTGFVGFQAEIKLSSSSNFMTYELATPQSRGRVALKKIVLSALTV